MIRLVQFINTAVILSQGFSLVIKEICACAPIMHANL